MDRKQIDYIQKWRKENSYRPAVLFPKEMEPQIRDAANGNLNGFILSAILEELGIEKDD